MTSLRFVPIRARANPFHGIPMIVHQYTISDTALLRFESPRELTLASTERAFLESFVHWLKATTDAPLPCEVTLKEVFRSFHRPLESDVFLALLRERHIHSPSLTFLQGSLSLHTPHATKSLDTPATPA